MKMPSVLRGVRRRLLWQLAANAVGQSGVLFLNALLIRFAFDRLLDGSSHGRSIVFQVGFAMTAGALLLGWLQRSERIIAEKLGQSYVHSLRMRLFRHVTRMDARLLQKKRRGAVMLKFIGDLNAIRRWVSLGLVRVVVSGSIVVSTLVVLSLIAPALAAAAGLLVVAGILINTRIGESLRGASLESRRRRSRLSANISEKLARMAVVQVFGRTEREIRRVRRQSHQLRKAMVDRAGRIGAIRGVTHGGAALAAAAVLIVGVLQVNEGRTTPGTVAAAMAVLGFLVPALRNLGRVYEYYQEARVSRQKINQFLQTRPRIRRGSGLPDLEPGAGKLIFDGVAVKGVLKDVSATVAPGSVITLTGANGAGKSTLIGLASRLVQADRGRVLIDGQDIAKVNVESVRSAVGVVSPDLPLLAGSLEMNLRYRCPGCKPEELDRIKRLCGIDDVVKQLPRGADTRIQEGGRNLSLGQRQRILLARALVGTPRILLLDEVDAHMDAASREILYQAIRTYPGTVIWVTHRTDTPVQTNADWKLENGRLEKRLCRNRSLRVAG